jgi:hypothetical protein
MIGFNAGTTIRGRASGGTRAVPTATTDGRAIIGLAAHGHDGTAWGTGGATGYIALVADGLWSGTNRGIRFEWHSTPNGSTTRTQWMILQSGSLCIGTGYTAGNGLLQLASGTTKANGIAFGTDTFLYRSGASLVRLDSAQMIGSGVGFTNGAGSGAGTLTNAPVAGNPTKWVPINDNGTTRYIPAW